MGLPPPEPPKNRFGKWENKKPAEPPPIQTTEWDAESLAAQELVLRILAGGLQTFTNGRLGPGFSEANSKGVASKMGLVWAKGFLFRGLQKWLLHVIVSDGTRETERERERKKERDVIVWGRPSMKQNRELGAGLLVLLFWGGCSELPNGQDRVENWRRPLGSLVKSF